MFCSRCGKEIDDKAVICVHCGCSVGNATIKPDDAPSAGFAVLGFFIPLVGLILYLIYNEGNRPLRAKSAGKGALIGFIVRVVISIISGIIYIIGVGILTDKLIDFIPSDIGYMDDYADDDTVSYYDTYSSYYDMLIGDHTDEILESYLEVTIGDFIIEKNKYFDYFEDSESNDYWTDYELNNYLAETKLNVTVKNKDNSRHSYSIKIEAVDENGARLDTDTVYAHDLNNNQEMHLDAFEYVDWDKIEEFRTASFKVLEVSMY